MPKNKNGTSVPPRILAMHKHPNTKPKIPCYKHTFAFITQSIKYSNFFKDIVQSNKDTTVVDRPTTEEAWAAICKSKAGKEGLWTEGRLIADRKVKLEEELRAAICQIHGGKGWDMRRSCGEQKAAAKGKFGLELDIVSKYNHNNDIIPEDEIIARLKAEKQQSLPPQNPEPEFSFALAYRPPPTADTEMAG